MVEVTYLKARKLDAIRLGRDLRPEDQIEVDAMYPGVDIGELMWDQIQGDPTSTVVYFGGDIGAIFGCGPSMLDSSVGVPWMMGSTTLRKHPRLVCDIAAEIILTWTSSYEVLRNVVCEKAEANVNFLNRVGFFVHPADNGYHLFEMEGAVSY